MLVVVFSLRDDMPLTELTEVMLRIPSGFDSIPTDDTDISDSFFRTLKKLSALGIAQASLTLLSFTPIFFFFDALFLAALKMTRYWLTQIFTRFARSTDNSWQSMIPSPHFSTTTPKTEKNIIQQTLCISHSVFHYYIIHYLIFYDIAV